MLSINYTTECRKNPRCSFCYLKKQRVLDLLKSDNPIEKDWDQLLMTVNKLTPKVQQFAIAYNGIDLWRLIALVEMISNRCVIEKRLAMINITTNPEFIDTHHIRYLNKISACNQLGMWSLSLDEEKCTINEWIKKAKIVKKCGKKVGANILMTDSMFRKIENVLKRIAPYADQIHLLRPKYIKVKIPARIRKPMLFVLKSIYKNLYVDECFNWELTGKPCSRGKDFVSVNPDGSISKCSFDGNNIYSKGRLRKCPFI